MKFHFIDQAKKEFPVSRLCYLMGVSQSGYFALMNPLMILVKIIRGFISILHGKIVRSAVASALTL